MKSLAAPALLLTLLLLVIGASAQANTLGLEDCGSCDGSDVSLEVVSDGGTGWNAYLKIELEDYNGSEDSIVLAGFKAVAGVTADDITLVSVSDGTTWSEPALSSISSSSFCSGPGQSNFACIQADTGSPIVTDPGYYILYTFHVDGGTLLEEWTIRFQYCDSADYDGGDGDCNGHIISEKGTPVPEPSAALIFAGALLVAAPKLRRRR